MEQGSRKDDTYTQKKLTGTYTSKLCMAEYPVTHPNLQQEKNHEKAHYR